MTPQPGILKRSQFFALALLIASTLTCQSNYSLNPLVKRAIDSTYTALIKKHKVTGTSLAIVDSGKIVYATGYGFADRENKVAANERTIYRIGSGTKSFTSLSIMQLHEKGLLSIDNSVKDYLPELTIGSVMNDKNPLYIKDMMCHVSGLPCDVLNGFFCDAPPDINWLILELNKQVTISPRLYKRAYSNIAYGLLGEVIARKSNTTYNNYLKQNIFNPLEMASSCVDMDAGLLPRYAKAYVDDKLIIDPMIRDQAAGLIHCDAVDMAQFIKMLLARGRGPNGRLISEESILAMEKNQMGNTLLSCQSDWGYGLYSAPAGIVTDKDTVVRRIIGHGGDTYAFHSDYAYIPEEGVGVVVLTNSDKGVYMNDATRLLKLYLKTAKKKTLLPDYKKGMDTPPCAAAECKAGNEGVKGIYNMGSLLINVKNAKKIKFRQGPAFVVMKEKKKKPYHYSARAKIFGIVPVKIKDTEFSFRTQEGKVYLTQTNTRNKKTDYVTFKSENTSIPVEWMNKLGRYKVTGKVFACTNCSFGNFEGLEIELKADRGFIEMKTISRYPKKSSSVQYLNVINAQLCQGGGIGRGTGETVRILENGNIYFSGFEFEKLK